MVVKITFAILISISLTGCLNTSFDTIKSQMIVREQLTDSLAANNTAQTYADWHGSDYHTEKIFSNFMAQLIQRSLTDAEVCSELLELKSEELTLFENEIRATEFREIVKSCYAELNSRLESYWKSQKVALDQIVPLAAPAFARFEKTEVITRDVSKGYYAVTGDLAPKQVMLTFDDGPSGIYTEKILATLEKSNVKALFFELGQQVKRYPQIVQKVANAGHSIGSHSNTHRCLPTKSLCQRTNKGKILNLSEAIADLRGGHQAIYNVLGWVDPFIRFPYGESSADLKAYLKSNSIGEFFWSIDSEDWMNSHSTTDVIELVMSELNARGRGIILFHDIQRKTVEGLPTLLLRLQDAGYQPVVMVAKDPLARTNSKIVIPKTTTP